MLTFENASVRAGFSRSPDQGYEATWYRFENATGESAPLGSATKSLEERLQSPGTLPLDTGAFIRVSIRALAPDGDPLAVPVDVYFRRAAEAWELVGLERMVSRTASSGG